MKFPHNFLFGSATAALHIEGGDKNNNWYRWSEMGRIKDGTHSVVACDHWNRIDQDVALVKNLNNHTYRLGIEWSRIMPSENEIDYEALKKYRYEIEELIKINAKPLVTLWHFCQPLWIEDSGGWMNPKTIEHFLKLTDVVVNYLGDLVSDWITLNEPNVYLTFAYVEGEWPPGKQGDIKSYIKGAGHFITAHQKAYDTIHSIRKSLGYHDTNVGVAHHVRVLDPLNNRWLDRQSIKLMNRMFHDIFIEGMTTGKVLFPVKSDVKRKHCADFIGLNYYSRDMIKGCWKPIELFGERLLKAGCSVNELEWEIYPEGLYRLCKHYYEKYNLPIYITENGTCDSRDAFRGKFIFDHLTQVHKAISEGIDVQRYYHWTLMDNFEWAEGNSARFGLYHNDFDTQVRTIRESGKYYAEICKRRVVEPFDSSI